MCCVAWVLRSSPKTRKRKRNWPGRAWVLEDAKDWPSNEMSYEAALGMSHTNDGSCAAANIVSFWGEAGPDKWFYSSYDGDKSSAVKNESPQAELNQ
jgi:hypothetical protein